MRNKIVSIMFITILLVTAIGQKSYYYFGDLLNSALKAVMNGSGTEEEEDPQAPMKSALAEWESNLADSLPYKVSMTRLNGGFLKKTGTRSYYNDAHGMNITTTGYNVGYYKETSTDYEVQEMIEFKEYLDARGIDLLYVNEPAKYIEDDFFLEQFGRESYLNRNADLFLQRIKEAGIEYLDLRDTIRQEGLDGMELFYKTDHHWTVPASEWAAKQIALTLNEKYGYHIDTGLYDLNNYNRSFREKCWLGEQGKLVGDSYLGLDDYTMLEPVFDTDFKISDKEGNIIKEGDFNVFIDKSIPEKRGSYYESPSWHYTYNFYQGSEIINANADYGNVLLLGDSYESSMAPFLALGIRNLTVIVPRNITTSVHSFVEQGEYDTVIIAYAQFMIGAHDNKSSANYKMFTLD